MTPELEQHIAAVAERVDMFGPDRQYLIEDGERRFVPHHFVKDQTVILPRFGRLAFHGQRPSDQFQCFRVPTLLAAQNAEQVQRIELVRLVLKNLQVDRLGIAQPALPMKLCGQTEHSLERKRIFPGY
jgi:hypothetical protein